jgi:hypothetical protein
MAKLTENERNEQPLFGWLQLIYRHVSIEWEQLGLPKTKQQSRHYLMKSLSTTMDLFNQVLA